ncbi:MAG: NAD(P)/FAD-dependent oxidoreductase [Treponema sp.]|jgi:NADPH-dependent 2,4-dienoyl-CoA reductase/sulfur reductase-like enzyme|nr:NAD(P)/FAD-dependent oxidoreductase [Treponema sp.]
MMDRYDVLVVGAGPGGLGAAAEAARCGGKVALLDENTRPGGQLFKQIHKFFGSREHMAGMRGYKIGEELLTQVQDLGVAVSLNTHVWGIFPGGRVTAVQGNQSRCYHGAKIVLATGASENALSFPGSTLPGVMTAGAAQTLMNLYHVLPGKRVAVVGSGNVGLIVAYQLIQAGAEVAAIIEFMPGLSGYQVHGAKVRRAGVPIYFNHTVTRAYGGEELAGITIQRVDEKKQPLPGTEKNLALDTLCIAAGLSPRIELSVLSKCRTVYSPALGGLVPLHTEDMETSNPEILVAGDLSGVEEASTALDEGRLAGLTAAWRLGLNGRERIAREKEAVKNRLAVLRQGPFGAKRQEAKKKIWEAARIREKGE